VLNVRASIAFHARNTPDASALIWNDEVISYAQFDARITNLAAWLVSKGTAPGDRVALIMKNAPAFLEIAYAASHVGAVWVPVNYRLAADEIAYILDHAGAGLVFADEEFAALVDGRDDTVVLDQAARDDTSTLVPKKLGPAPPVPRGAEDLARIVYTSGTTSRPKGVMHSNANIHWKNYDHVAVLGLGPDTHLLVVGPLYHVGAFDLPGVAVLSVGGSLCLLAEFSPQAVLRAIDRHRLTGGWMAPVMLGEVLAVPGRVSHDLSSLAWLVGGGERTPEPRIRAFGAAFANARYIDAYGLTESGAGDTFMEPGRELEKIGSTGRAIPHIDIEIRDPDGAVAAPGEDGEICLRGPKVTAGYWRDDAATAAAFHPGGWLRTGDIGHLDADGFLTLTDRAKDMIISGGENIASLEIERALYEMPEVAEAAAIPRADPHWGERPVAVIVPVPGRTLDLAAVQAHCRARLAGFKVPKELILAETLPRNPSGKILKRALREQYP
jgi:fatty-acyl-CoA synthase